MKVLRLGNSEDVREDIPLEKRAYAIAARRLEEACGEPVETVPRVIWPEPELPDLVREWLDRYEPDIVFLKVTWYWWGYESVPRRIERKLGRVGKPVAQASLKAADISWLSTTRPFKFGRRLAHRLIGGDPQFRPEQVISVMEATIRAILAKEGVGLVVKATGGGRAPEGALADYFDAFVKRRELVEGSIKRFCEGLGVVYIAHEKPVIPNDPELKRGDGIHRGTAGHMSMGDHEGGGLVQAWRAMVGDGATASRG
ncbi:MAG: hypothetical protein HY875_16530 [Chloroflexi bacterium]|nr:hypothetical protein [Chloroflexota bacterium]